MHDGIDHLDSIGRRQLAAIMFTDIVGFSRRVGEDEVRTLRLVQRDLHLIAETSKQYSGRILKNTGDGCMALFDSGVQALECAQALQRHFAEQAQINPPEECLQHRIGIHLGDVFMSDGEVMGDGVNIAARLQAEAPPGGICISQALYEVVKTRLAFRTTQVGARRLKNIAEDVVIYQVLIDRPAVGAMAGITVPELEPDKPRLSLVRSISILLGALLLIMVATIVVLILRKTPATVERRTQVTVVNPPPAVPAPPGAEGSAVVTEPEPNATPKPAATEPAPTPTPTPSTLPAPDAGPEDYDTAKARLLQTRDYQGIVDWLKAQNQADAHHDDAVKYQQLADFFAWINTQVQPYTEANALTVTTRAGDVKVWGAPGGLVLDGVGPGRVTTTLGRIPQPMFIVHLAARLEHARWESNVRDRDELNRVVSGLDLFARDNLLDIDPILARLKALGEGR
jgi:class 3 adenylate cyclase